MSLDRRVSDLEGGRSTGTAALLAYHEAHRAYTRRQVRAFIVGEDFTEEPPKPPPGYTPPTKAEDQRLRREIKNRLSRLSPDSSEL